MSLSRGSPRHSGRRPNIKLKAYLQQPLLSFTGSRREPSYFSFEAMLVKTPHMDLAYTPDVHSQGKEAGPTEIGPGNA